MRNIISRLFKLDQHGDLSQHRRYTARYEDLCM